MNRESGDHDAGQALQGELHPRGDDRLRAGGHVQQGEVAVGGRARAQVQEVPPVRRGLHGGDGSRLDLASRDERGEHGDGARYCGTPLGTEDAEAVLDLQHVLVLEELHFLGIEGELADAAGTGIGEEKRVKGSDSLDAADAVNRSLSVEDRSRPEKLTWPNESVAASERHKRSSVFLKIRTSSFPATYYNRHGGAQSYMKNVRSL